jgi:hypothetical protein
LDAKGASRGRLNSFQSSTKASRNWNIICSVWTGEGVKRNRSVPTGTVGSKNNEMKNTS